MGTYFLTWNFMLLERNFFIQKLRRLRDSITIVFKTITELLAANEKTRVEHSKRDNKNTRLLIITKWRYGIYTCHFYYGYFILG